MKDKSKNIHAIVQARYGSTRLPGKILKPLAGKPMLWHVINRLKHCKLIDKIILATTVLPQDDPVEIFCRENNISYYRGSSDDVLSRYYEAAKKNQSDTIIRITADCPLIDPVIIDRMLESFIELEKDKYIYMSNVNPRKYPRGLDAEIFSFASLEKTFNEAKLDYEREHVTPYIYQHPDLFVLKSYAPEKDYSFHRWTVDTEEDFKLIQEIYNSLYNEKSIFLFEDILKLFDQKPGLININQNVQQKKLRD